MSDVDRIYKSIGEFTVAFQRLENKLREIGWFILDPDRKQWPPISLRTLSNENLVKRVHELFLKALPGCELPSELEVDLKESFATTVDALHHLRRIRNRILHSAFIDLKAGGEVHGLLRSNPKVRVDEESGRLLFDQEVLTPTSFSSEMEAMAKAALFLNRAYIQLIHRYPHGANGS